MSDRIWEGQSATGKYQRQIGISQLCLDFCGFLVMEGASWSNRVEAELLDTGKKFPVEVGNPFPAILFFFSWAADVRIKTNQFQPQKN